MSLEHCQLVIDPPAAGAWNMALDEALLIGAAEGGRATLRFYQWNEPTLSLGYFQRYDDRQQHAASRQAAVVRRQSGGGAIMHDRELTYSVTLPAAHPLARDTEKLYNTMHAGLVDAIHALVPGSPAAWSLRLWDCQSSVPRADQPFLCFQRRSCGDVLCATPTGGPAAKIVGSAQRRRRGAVLQHGSILLARSAAAPELAGIRELTGNELVIDALIDSLVPRLAESIGPFEPSQIFEETKQRAEQIEQDKYASDAWNQRR